jgi:hypothetical protein
MQPLTPLRTLFSINTQHIHYTNSVVIHLLLRTLFLEVAQDTSLLEISIRSRKKNHLLVNFENEQPEAELPTAAGKLQHCLPRRLHQPFPAGDTTAVAAAAARGVPGRLPPSLLRRRRR